MKLPTLHALTIQSYMVLLIIIASSCHTKIKITQVSKEAASLTISLNNSSENVLKSFGELFNNSHIIDLNMGNPEFISTINKVILFHNKLYILDVKFSSLYCYDTTGRLMLKYGKVGLNYQDYKKITDFDIDSVNNRMVVFSTENKSVYYYNLSNGLFAKKLTINLSGSHISLVENGNILVYANYSRNDHIPGANVVLIDSEANIKKGFFPFNQKLEDIDWASTGFLNKTGDSTYFSTAFSDTIYVYKNGDFTPSIIIKCNSDKITKMKFNHRQLYSSQILVDPKTSFLRSHFIINGKSMIFSYQFDQWAKNGIYDIKEKKLKIISPDQNDALLNLARDPLFISKNNEVIFNIFPQDIMLLKEQKVKLLNGLSPENQKVFNNANASSGSYLLISKLNR